MPVDSIDLAYGTDGPPPPGFRKKPQRQHTPRHIHSLMSYTDSERCHGIVRGGFSLPPACLGAGNKTVRCFSFLKIGKYKRRQQKKKISAQCCAPRTRFSAPQSSDRNSRCRVGILGNSILASSSKVQPFCFYPGFVSVTQIFTPAVPIATSQASLKNLLEIAIHP